MTDQEFLTLFNKMRNSLKDNDSAAYSEEARKWAVDEGLIKGGDILPDGTPNYMWEDYLTREQFVTVLHRFFEMVNK